MIISPPPEEVCIVEEVELLIDVNNEIGKYFPSSTNNIFYKNVCVHNYLSIQWWHVNCNIKMKTTRGEVRRKAVRVTGKCNR
jgi:hypothetical protein